MKKIKVLLVDDQVLFVESLKTVLMTRAKDIQIVGIANNGQEAIEMVGNLIPDIVLMDIRMPGINGVESTKKITEQFPYAKILVLTTFDDDEYVIDALKCGAFGYLMKDVPVEELIAAIHAVYEGGVMISPVVASKLINMAHKNGKNSNQSDNQNKYRLTNELTEREKDVLKLMAQGLENKEIAEKLFFAEQTIKNYVSNIYSKLEVHDRVQATLIAIEDGLVKRVNGY